MINKYFLAFILIAITNVCLTDDTKFTRIKRRSNGNVYVVTTFSTDKDLMPCTPLNPAEIVKLGNIDMKKWNNYYRLSSNAIDFSDPNQCAIIQIFSKAEIEYDEIKAIENQELSD